MSSALEPVGDVGGRLPVRFIVAVVVPLAIVALAFASWSLGNQRPSIGPLDRAAFGWLVVLPIWIAAPVVAGFAWSHLPSAGRVLAALLVGATISFVAATLLWQALAPAGTTCQFGPISSSGEQVLPSLVVGVVLGGGLVASGLLVSRLAREGRPVRAIVVGAGAELALTLGAVVTAGLLILGPVCQRPPA